MMHAQHSKKQKMSESNDYQRNFVNLNANFYNVNQQVIGLNNFNFINNNIGQQMFPKFVDSKNNIQKNDFPGAQLNNWGVMLPGSFNLQQNFITNNRQQSEGLNMNR